MNLKDLLPIANYVLRTDLSYEKVLKLLSENMDPNKKMVAYSFFGTNTGKEYKGEINGNVFTMRRVLKYRNSANPEIRGEVYTSNGHTEIKIKMRIDTIVLVLIITGLAILSYTLPGEIARLLTSGEYLPHGFSLSDFFNFAVPIFIYSVTLIVFRAEIKTTKIFLEVLLNAETVG